jgi:hypothetical protein
MNELWLIGMLVTVGMTLSTEVLEFLTSRGKKGLAIAVVLFVLLFLAWPAMLGAEIRRLLEDKR